MKLLLDPITNIVHYPKIRRLFGQIVQGLPKN